MSIKLRLCIGDYPLPLEDVDAETLGGIRKGYLLNLTQCGNYKWLEKALEMSEKKQEHRFYRGGGAKFKTLEEMQDAIHTKTRRSLSLKRTFEAIRSFFRIASRV